VKFKPGPRDLDIWPTKGANRHVSCIITCNIGKGIILRLDLCFCEVVPAPVANSGDELSQITGKTPKAKRILQESKNCQDLVNVLYIHWAKKRNCNSVSLLTIGGIKFILVQFYCFQ
jgi:hypothetical protein